MKSARAINFALVFLASIALFHAVAAADIDTSVGLQYNVPAGTIADCGTKAQSSLNAYLKDAQETPTGSGDWVAYGPNGRGPTTSATATVHCVALAQGYLAVFDCTVETPNNPYKAADLCLNIEHTFSGQAVTALATPTPPPSGCAANNLVGKWSGKNKDGDKVSFTMSADGNLEDQDGVSGNWIMNGSTVTLTYYGNNTLTLSPDGKHLNGGGFSLTRDC